LVKQSLKERADKHASPTRKKAVAVLVEELRIEPYDGETRLLEALDEVDRADEFDRIRSEAFDKFRVDEPYEQPQWCEAVKDSPPPRAALAADMEVVAEQLQKTEKSKLTPEEIRTRSAGVT
jgi:hypothetical protein